VILAFHVVRHIQNNLSPFASNASLVVLLRRPCVVVVSVCRHVSARLPLDGFTPIWWWEFYENLSRKSKFG